jgi:hypothetical protein
MIRNKADMKGGPIEIDLTGPDGNAFVLIGIAKNIMKQLEYPIDKANAVVEKMMSGDYENLLKVMDEQIGDFIIMYR